MSAESQIFWTPVHPGLSQIANGRKIAFVIAPFIQAATLKFLLTRCSWVDFAIVITRWRAADIVSGVSDIAVYPKLIALNAKLFINDRLHMKAVVFDDGTAFLTSANVTDSGLGLCAYPNIEIGSRVILSDQDRSRLAVLLAQSNLVTEEIFNRASLYVKHHRVETPALPPLDLSGAPVCGAGGLDLPLSAEPDTVWQVYSQLGLDGGGGHDEGFEVALRDIETLGVPGGLGKMEFKLHVRELFSANPIVKDLINGLERQKSFCFGQVVSRMQRSAVGNVPMGRRELKPYARALYGWLPWVESDVSWDRPKHSMVLRYSGRSARRKEEAT